MDGSPYQQGSREFRPETFFVGRTEGGGVVRDAFGRVVRRCSVVTEGAWNQAKHSISFDETFTYDDGEIDIWRWVMSPGRDGRYVAAEAQIGTGVEGRRVGHDYVLTFRRPIGKASGVFTPHYQTRFTPMAAELVLKIAKVSLFGLPLGALTAVHRRVSPL